MGWIARVPLAVALLFAAAFVVLPLLVMLWETLDSPAAYGEVLTDSTAHAQLLYSAGLGLVATAIAFLLGCGHAWLTFRTDLPGASVLGPLGVAPLVIPPILVAMGFADLADVAGFWSCALLLGVSYAPFVAVLTARGLRSVDGRLYEAALLSRGRLPADRMLFRMVLPEITAGCLFAFIFVVSEHGVPEFLTVKGKAWHTYAEGIFARWTRRAMGVGEEDLVGPVIAAVPLVLIIMLALFLALRLRAHSNIRGSFQPLPIRRLQVWRWPALLLPFVYLGCGVGVPVLVMARWAAGSTVVNQPMAFATVRESVGTAIAEAGSDLTYTTAIAAVTVVVLLLVATPLARLAARRLPAVDYLAVLPVAVPAILLAIGFVKVFNHPVVATAYDSVGDFYDSWTIVAVAYTARFLPFGVLTLSHATRRISSHLEEAAALTGRSPVARALMIHLPLLVPALWSAACLVFILALRELDVAVVLPAGNGTVVRRLSNVVHFGGENMGGALALMLLFVAATVPTLTILLTGRKLRSLS
ncbi:MAG: ABC transporter permease [Planctomycetota bacterium]|jgi:iron(III) transport system permease protein